MMNDDQFHERAHANPHDDSQDFLAAAAASPQRQALVTELKALDTGLSSMLHSVSGSTAGRQAALAIPGSDNQAANDPAWRRLLPYAAVLVVAVGVLSLVLPGKANPMEDVVFRHLYSELFFFDDDSPMTLAEVNVIMSERMGTVFTDSPAMESLTINHSQDCYVDFENGIRGVHMVVVGDKGPVTVMIIANEPLASELAIADDRFSGIITPMPRGNMVVIGEKAEPIQQYSTLLAANINW